MKPIAFIDSGIGGLPYLSYLRNYLPQSDYVYVADNAGFPYGTKNEEEIKATVFSMVGRLVAAKDPCLIVVACNTASVVALEALRQAYPGLPFVGVVPAVKPAAEQSKKRSIAVLATERTIQGRYLDKLIQDYAKNCSVLRIAANDLIRKIETDPFMEDKEGYHALMEGLRLRLLSKGADSLVLGCTHFLHLNQEFKEVFSREFTIHDSREGVSRQVIRKLKEAGVLPADFEPLATFLCPFDLENDEKAEYGKAFFYLTKESLDETLYRRVSLHYELDFGGEL